MKIYSIGWCANEILESYHVFDNYDHGYIDAAELKRVFAKLGEKLTDEEIKDQVCPFVQFKFVKRVCVIFLFYLLCKIS